jgi:uncharacterized repeat protein (TIGR03803 family)
MAFSIQRVAAVNVAMLGLLVSAVELSAEAQPLAKTIYKFQGSPDGALPIGNLVIGANGVLYGATEEGGTQKLGTVYSLTPPAEPGGEWTEAVLASFLGRTGSTPGPAEPEAGPVLGADGALYGTTLGGGAYGLGTVYSLSPPLSEGGEWTLSVLSSFAGGDDGEYPSSPLVPGPGGVLYGTTPAGGENQGGGTSHKGTVFSMTPPSTPGPWTKSVLCIFPGGNSGAEPSTGVVVGPGGVLYGVAYTEEESITLVFSLTPPTTPDGAWAYAVIYTFNSTNDGRVSALDLSVGPGGVLYGPASSGGASGLGFVFSLTPPTVPGGSWTEQTLFSFPGNAGGQNPQSQLIIGPGGVLYGTAGSVVFSLTPPSSSGGAWTEEVLNNFAGGSIAESEFLTISPTGVFYGTQDYTAWEMRP